MKSISLTSARAVIFIVVLFALGMTSCKKKELPSARFTMEGAIKQYHCAEANFILDKSIEVISRVDREEFFGDKRDNEDKTSDRKFRAHYTYCLDKLQIEIDERTKIDELGVWGVKYRLSPARLLEYATKNLDGSQLIIELRSDPSKFFKLQHKFREKIEEGLDAVRFSPTTTTNDLTIVEEDGQWRVFMEYHALRGLTESGRRTHIARKLLENKELDQALEEYRTALNIVRSLQFVTPRLDQRRWDYYYLLLQYISMIAEKEKLLVSQLGLEDTRPFLRIIPVILEGRLYGYQVRGLSPTASEAGLKKGDVIQKINKFVPGLMPINNLALFLTELKKTESFIVNRGLEKEDLHTYQLPTTTDIRW
jgi:hypothetical protein